MYPSFLVCSSHSAGLSTLPGGRGLGRQWSPRSPHAAVSSAASLVGGCECGELLLAGRNLPHRRESVMVECAHKHTHMHTPHTCMYHTYLHIPHTCIHCTHAHTCIHHTHAYTTHMHTHLHIPHTCIYHTHIHLHIPHTHTTHVYPHVYTTHAHTHIYTPYTHTHIPCTPTHHSYAYTTHIHISHTYPFPKDNINFQRKHKLHQCFKQSSMNIVSSVCENIFPL